jgi:asparagine synthase (glutamine-hydrolysing)
MAVEINLTKNSGSRWYTSGDGTNSVWVKGYAFSGSTFLDKETFAGALLSRLREGLATKEAEEILHGLTGYFSIVLKSPSTVIAAVDHMRSMPFFYGTEGGTCYVSDEADWVRRKIKEEMFDEVSVNEFLLTGYVTGKETLYRNLKQLQAGEFLRVAQGPAAANPETRRYYFYRHHDFFDVPAAELHAELDKTLVDVFTHLLESTKGRRLMVPLSGGFDSRLVIAMLKRLGRENVLCYSYGLPGNRESEISKEVARRLGYPWEFIPYTLERWYKWFQSDERKTYYDYGDGLSSLPPVQDWPAVWQMKKAGIVPEDAVFIPGHTAAKRLAGHPVDASKGAVAQSVLGEHYNLWYWPEGASGFDTAIQEKILSLVKEVPIRNIDDAIGAFESWEWQARQARFIMNGCRVYEFWGYNWRVPLWDRELAAFFSRLKPSLRIRKNLYREYLSNDLFSHFDLNFTDGRVAGRQSPVIKKVLKKIPLVKKCMRWFKYDLRRIYENHPLAWYGIMPRKVFYALYHDGVNFNSFRVLERLGRVSFDSQG